MTTECAVQTPAKVIREARLDPIGFASLLEPWAKDQRTGVKMSMIAKGAERATGDCFEGLVYTFTPATIDTNKFVKLFERGGMSRAQFISCLTIKKDAAGEFLSRQEIEAISNEQMPVENLKVSRIKTVEVKLVDAVKRLAEAIRG
jgi:hypothetical protein